MLKFGKEPYLECSSKGYTAFSAFHAKLKAYNNSNIESLYQGFKIFECEKCENTGMINGVVCEDCQGAGRLTNLHWKAAKGKHPINSSDCIAYYDFLWKQYFYENPHLIDVIKQTTGFSDMFGQKGHCCQAEVMWRIKTGKLPLFTSVVNTYKHKYDVYCGRAGKNQDGKLGNPHPIGKRCHLCGLSHKKGEAVAQFRKDFYDKVERKPEYKDLILSLRGKRLGCFCKQSPNDNVECHCDVYVEFINNYFNDHPISL